SERGDHQHVELVGRLRVHARATQVKTLITLSMVLDWPEEELHELAASLDQSARSSMINGMRESMKETSAALELIEEILNEHFTFYGVSLMPQQELFFT